MKRKRKFSSIGSIRSKKPRTKRIGLGRRRRMRRIAKKGITRARRGAPRIGKGRLRLRRRMVRRQGYARRRGRSSSASYPLGFNQSYDKGYNAGFAKGFEEGHQIAYEQQL